jgi:hypothetical protein
MVHPAQPIHKSLLGALLGALCLVLAAGCAGTRFKVPKPRAVHTGYQAAVLPVIDSRSWPPGNTNIHLYPGKVRSLLIKGLAARTLFRLVFRADTAFLGGPDQVALRFTVSSFDISPAEYNVFSIPHAMLDALVTPVMTAAMLVSAGRVDLGAYVFPSRRYKARISLGLEVLDARTNQVVLGRSYDAEVYDYFVSEFQWMQRIYDSSDDGIRVGKAIGPKVIVEAIKKMSQDRVLAKLPVFLSLGRLAVQWQVAWPPDRRLGLIDRTEAILRSPIISPGEETLLRDNEMPLATKVEALNSMGINKVVKPYTAARVKSLEGRLHQVAEWGVNYQINEAVVALVLDWLAELTLKARTVGLTPVEMKLRESVLARLAPRLAADRRLRAMVTTAAGGDDAAAKGMTEAVVVLLRRAGDRASLAWIAKYQKEQLSLLPEVPRGELEEKNIARMLVVLMGRRAAAVLDKRDENLILGVVGPEDKWAEPLIMRRLAAGDFSPEVLRAAARVRPPGAAGLIWLRIKRTDDLAMPLYAGERRVVFDRSLAVQVIGFLPPDRRVQREMAQVVKQWWSRHQLPPGWNQATIRQAVTALGRQRPRGSGPLLLRLALPRLYPRPKPRSRAGEGYGVRPTAGETPQQFIRAQADAAVRAARRWPPAPPRSPDRTWPEPVVKRRLAGVTTWEVVQPEDEAKKAAEDKKKDKDKKDKKTADKKVKVVRPLVLFNPPPNNLAGAALWGVERAPVRQADGQVWRFVQAQVAGDQVGGALAPYLDYLGRQRVTQAVDLLFNVARHPGAAPETRLAAITALGRIGGPAAARRLRQLAAQLDTPLAAKARLSLALIQWRAAGAR